MGGVPYCCFSAAQLGLPLAAFFQLWIICFHPNNRLLRIPLQIAHILFFFPPVGAHTRRTNRRWDWYARYQHLQRQQHSPSSLSYRQQLIAYLLYCDISIETDSPFFPRRDGCFIMFKRTIYCSRVDPRSHLLGRLSRR